MTKVVKAFRLPKPPLFLVAVPVVGFCLLLLAAAVIFKARYATSPDARYAPVQDMARQPKMKAQAVTSFFADGRADREPVAGTVAYAAGSFDAGAADAARLKADDHLYRGYKTDAAGKPVVKGGDKAKSLEFFSGYPTAEGFKVDAALLAVGHAKYRQNCAMCHGLDGSGNGPVDARATVLASEENNPSATSWTKPADLRADTKTQAGGYPNGRLFFTINHGVGAMAGYSAQLSEREAWAIVAYVRALQRTAK